MAFDRLFWSGNSSTPHGWWASRVATPLDYEFDLDATDVQQAINGTNLDGGNIGEKITAMLAHNRECLLFWRYRLNARYARRSAVGWPAGNALPCRGPLVRRRGAKRRRPNRDSHPQWALRDGGGLRDGPQQLSKQRLPDALMGIDRDTDAFLAYDSRFDGVHIYVTEKAGASTARQAGGWTGKRAVSGR